MRNVTSRIVQALVVTVVLTLAAACNQGGSGAASTREAGPATQAATQAAASATDQGGGAGGPSGEARIELSGDVSETLDLSVDAFSSIQGYVNATWVDDSGGMLIIAGQAEVGSVRTDFDLPLTLDTADASFTSSGGECTVEFTRVDEGGVEGSFECTDVIGGPTANLTVDMTGTFSAES